MEKKTVDLFNNEDLHISRIGPSHKPSVDSVRRIYFTLFPEKVKENSNSSKVAPSIMAEFMHKPKNQRISTDDQLHLAFRDHIHRIK